ncbi:hypothetical protein CDV31_007680 [Fusarium ambrosium]|uniref:NmrA-like domain-containing protein n=1 Tax=Fusarium ambrosium TaxID=131363 RepID=A0A428U5Q5_9HYPO|nr:hypothetical protein CDV31_007680 [Fusarium ambrosium]
MAPTILVVGATGNTGRGVVETLSELLKTTPFSSHKILALTRSSSGAAAQLLARLPNVELVEQSWVEITLAWLRQHNVERAFIASHNQPNQFAEESTFHLATLQAGVQLMASEDAPVGIIDPYEVGRLAAHLLIQNDVTPHDKARYVLNSPENITGLQVVTMTEEVLGTRVEDVSFRDLSFIDHMAAAQTQESKNVILSIKYAPETAWEGKCTASTTSREVLQLAAPRNTPAEIFKAMLEG